MQITANLTIFLNTNANKAIGDIRLRPQSGATYSLLSHFK